MIDFFSLLITGFFISSVTMFFLWGSYLIHKKPAIVDLGWACSVFFIVFFYFCSIPIYSLRSFFVLFLTSLWSFRLSFLLSKRLLRGEEDRRYVKLSKQFGSGSIWKYFLFFQAQALLASLLTVPHLFSLKVHGHWTIVDTIGSFLFVVGFLGESLADRQMEKFRKHIKGGKKVCTVGLWYYSRHPNYFFEWMIWVSFFIFGWNHPLGFIGIISPGFILYTLLYITGIPPNEERMIESKGEAYRAYQKSTNAFFPWYPKE